MIFNEITNEFEPPFKAGDLNLYDGVTEALKLFSENDYRLFLVSNQPDHAKGKTKIENLKIVHDKLQEILKREEIFFTEYYYCYHHPEGIVKEYTLNCECRKPKPFFVFKAINEYNIDSGKSWFIGDRDTDIECGKASGLKTILIENPDSENYRGKSDPDHKAADLFRAAEIILNHQQN